MKKSDLNNSDMLRDWVDATGKDKAPVGFTQNVMSQVAVEPVYSKSSYRSPVSTTFKIGTSLFVSVIVILAFVLPDSQSTIIPDLNLDFLNIIDPGKISLPSLNLPPIQYLNYMLYASAGIFLLIGFDVILNIYFTETEKKKAQQ